jgi:hypothetical protein
MKGPVSAILRQHGWRIEIHAVGGSGDDRQTVISSALPLRIRASANNIDHRPHYRPLIQPATGVRATTSTESFLPTKEGHVGSWVNPLCTLHMHTFSLLLALPARRLVSLIDVDGPPALAFCGCFPDFNQSSLALVITHAIFDDINYSTCLISVPTYRDISIVYPRSGIGLLSRKPA